MATPTTSPAGPYRWRAPRPELPAPTADEVAAVRARIDARRRPVRGDRWLVGGAVVALVVAAVGLFVVDLVVEDGDHVRWVTVLAGVMLLVIASRRAGHVRRVDDAVRRRLGEDAGPGRPTGDFSRFEVVVGVFCLATLALQLAGVVATVGPRPDDRLFVAAVAVLAAVAAAVVVRAVRSPGVGGGPVLRAVDGALRRRDVLTASFPALWTGLFATSGATSAAAWSDLRLASVGVALVLLVVAALRRDDEWLLRDPRIRSAPEPQVWLSRS